ncbi:MAG: MltA-interacting MipA family protein [Verrucomicrobia bacterium]|nr:MltA-interacting MipA family protein [Verrucomicrobiota bacterium]
MRNGTQKVIACLGAAVALTMVPTAMLAAEASLDAAVFSAYDWRGQVINDEAVLQPALDVTSASGLGLNVWGNFDLTDKIGDSGEFSEVDITVSYDLGLGEDFPVGAQVGLIEYLFPKEGHSVDSTGAVANDADTREVYLALSKGVSGFDVSLTGYLDIDEVDGAYLNASVEHAVPVAEELGLVVGASVGYATSDYNKAYFGVDDSALNDVTFSLSGGVSVTDNLSVGGEVHYVILPDSDIEKAAKASYGEDDYFWGGVTASLAL